MSSVKDEETEATQSDDMKKNTLLVASKNAYEWEKKERQYAAGTR